MLKPILKVKKKSTKKCVCWHDMFVLPPKNSATNSKWALRNKKDKLADLSFLFLIAHFEFETEILVDCTNISGGHPQFFLEFFDTFKNVFFLLMFVECIVSPKVLYH